MLRGPKGIHDKIPRDPWTHSRNGYFDVYLFFNYGNVLLKIIKKLPVPTKRSKIFLLKVKSCNALFRMLLVCISSYLKSFLKYKFLILGTHHPNTPNLREPSCMDPRLFFDAKRGPRAKTFGKHRARPFFFCFLRDVSVVTVREGGGGGLESLVILC